MYLVAGLFIVGLLGLGLWVIVEHIIDKMFNNDDLGDSDYGC